MMIRILGTSLLALVVAGCHGIVPTQPTPFNPADFAPIGPPPPVVQPPGPHFALEIHGDATTYTGTVWRGTVTITQAIGIVRPDLPTTVTATCAAQVTEFPGFRSGVAPFSCLLPVGTHTVLARAHTADGRVYAAATTATIVAVPAPASTPMTITVTTKTQGVPPVHVHHFTTLDILASHRYRWSFDDRRFDTTLVPRTTHAFETNGEYRVEVTAIDDHGLVIGFGSVAVVVNHH